MGKPENDNLKIFFHLLLCIPAAVMVHVIGWWTCLLAWIVFGQIVFGKDPILLLFIVKMIVFFLGFITANTIINIGSIIIGSSLVSENKERIAAIIAKLCFIWNIILLIMFSVTNYYDLPGYFKWFLIFAAGWGAVVVAGMTWWIEKYRDYGIE